MTSGNLESMSYGDCCGMREIEVKFLKGGGGIDRLHKSIKMW